MTKHRSDTIFRITITLAMLLMQLGAITTPASATGALTKVIVRVWEDRNINGLQDEPTPIPGVPVTLYTCTGTAVSTIATNTDGYSTFIGMNPGSYYAEIAPPQGYAVTLPDQGTDDLRDSDIDPATRRTPCFDVPTNVTVQGKDGGLYKPSSLGDRVWEDANINGIQDSGELGIPNVRVELYACGGSMLAATNTDAAGLYRFSGLMPGSYSVRFIAPAGYTFSPQDQGGSEALDSDANPATGITGCVTLGYAQIYPDLDGGLYKPVQQSSICGYVYVDADNDGIFDPGESPIEGAVVSLDWSTPVGTLHMEMTTGADGRYCFTGLEPNIYYTVTETQPAGYLDGKDTQGTPGNGTVSNDVFSSIFLAPNVNGDNNNFGELRPASICGYAYVDADNDGIFDPGETPIQGVTVSLSGTNDLGAPVSMTASTGADGRYCFNNLRPGSYTVTETQPAGYDDGRDTQGTPGTGTTGNDVFTNITLPPGVNGDNNNFGELRPASICGFVYVDADNDGVFDAGESPIQGVAVSLSGTDDLGASVSMAVSTGADGRYCFNGLRPGSYTVTETQPAAYLDGKDTQGTPGTGTTGNDVFTNITLPPGFNGDNNNFGELRPASICGYVYMDADDDGVFDAGENPLSGVEVTLSGTDDLGNPVSRMTMTGADGRYCFSSLRPGTYTVTETQPPGYDDGKDTQGTPGTGTTGNDVFTNITLPPGFNGDNNNFGERVRLSCSLDVSKTCFAPPPSPAPFVCSDAKPIDSLSMIWTGSQTVRVVAWYGAVGTRVVSTVSNIAPGDTITINGYAGSPNDVSWEIFDAVTGVKLGESSFHLSCSDSEMNGPEDCGLMQGNGKSNLAGLINLWKFDGMGGNGLTLDCSPGDPGGTSYCTAAPGAEITYNFSVTNLGDSLSGVRLFDDPYGEIVGAPGFSLASGETRTFSAAFPIFESTTNTGVFAGTLANGQTCSGEDSSTVDISFDGCAACKGGVTQLILRYSGSQTGTVAVYEGTDRRADKLLYQGSLGAAPFMFTGVRSDATMGTTISIWINGVLHTTIHTSCSQPIGPGLTAGDFTVVSGRSKDNGLMCPLKTCAPSAAPAVVFSGREVQWTVTNQGDLGLEIKSISITWPAANGYLDEVKRDGDVIYTTNLNPPSAEISSGWSTAANKRTIAPGDTNTLKFKFQNNASRTEAYIIHVEFTGGCAIDVTYTPPYIGGNFICSTPISSISMFWNGAAQNIQVKAWKGVVGSVLLANMVPVVFGQELTVGGYAGSPNDVIWEIFDTNGGKLGESTFHLSCSDADMNGPDDCGKPAGDGKSRTGFLNSWLFEGMIDSNEELNCTR